MDAPSVHETIPPVPATAVVVDLRNFTSHLNAASEDDDGVNLFCRFLAGFYALCLDAALIAMPADRRPEPPLYITSTGDGVLMVFTDTDWHFGHGYLTALVLHQVLARACGRYNESLAHPDLPGTSFGIGIESGRVARIRATAVNDASHPVIDTYIGECINVASRAQEVTKQLYEAHTLVCATTNTLLCHQLFGESYPSLMVESGRLGLADEQRIALHNHMNGLNRRLCLAFLHQHKLRGVARPLPLFRLSESAARLGNPRFDHVLELLTRGDAAHLDEVRTAVRGC